MTLKHADIARARSQNQRIARGALNSAHEVVRWLGAVQAQDYLGALWGIGSRMRNAVETDIEDAIAARTIVRTWPMRGTLHFVPASDVRWMLSLLTPRVTSSTAGRYRQLELDDEVFARSESILVRALEGGRQLSRPNIYELLNDAGISVAESRGLHILSWLAQKQVLIFGTREGKQQRFTLFEEWVPTAPTPTREEALARLATRYFSSHGPASEQDFSWWSGLPLRDVREAIALASNELVRDSIDDLPVWCGSPVPSRTAQSERAYLLPPFDEYIVAYRTREFIVDPAFAPRIAAGGMFNPVIVFAGRVVGTWSRTLKKDRVVIEARPFETPDDPSREAVESAAERYGAFLGLRATLA